MKRVLTSLVVLLVVFVVFALVIGQLRIQPVQLRILFFPTIRTSAEALAYVSFFIGLLLATVIALVGDMALRKRFRGMLPPQNRRPRTGGGSKDIADTTKATSPGECKSPE